jgi:hypothetical protein
MSTPPGEADDREQRWGEVLVACLEALESGQAADRQALTAAHPEFAEKLAEFLVQRDWIARLAVPPRAGAPGAAGPTAPGLREDTCDDAAGSSPDAPVRSFGDYEILARIARGGMGEVYRARQVSLNRVVALKMIRRGDPGSEEEQRFRQEAEIVAQLDHPHIVPIYEVGSAAGRRFFSMKLMEGGSPALTATAGTAFSGTVATFTDTDATLPASLFRAAITWGNGQTSPGTVSGGSGNFSVSGGNTYAQEGSYPLSVAITPTSAAPGTAPGRAHVARVGAPPGNLTVVANLLTHSFEYYARVVTAAYQNYLGRTPAPSEVAGWVGALQNALSDEQMEAVLIGSPEYIANHGGQGAGWVTGMYHDLLGRTPAPAEVTGWVNALNGGLAPAAVAYVFAAGPEREAERITADYQKYLDRLPEPGIVTAWVGAFESGYGNESVIAGFVGSQEYFQKHYDNVTDWLFSAYDDAFGRDPDPAALQGWTQFLQNS